MEQTPHEQETADQLSMAPSDIASNVIALREIAQSLAAIRDILAGILLELQNMNERENHK